MNKLHFSLIIPVYNRPEEVRKLLESIKVQDFGNDFEVVIVEDGSSLSSKEICFRFRESVHINYLFKANSGPGDSRNYGMERARGNYFIILDSDCVLPPTYLTSVKNFLNRSFVDCYGGPDAAHENFSHLQKAINYSMTSFLTTGGIRGGNEALGKFQPRSFNMGLSKEAFEATNGFGKIHPGEDPDLSIRLWKLGYNSVLIKEAYVFHERRISWDLFYKQVNKFGKVRVILNKWHPETRKLTYWFPSIFTLGLMFSFVLLPFGIYQPFLFYVIYLILILFHASWLNGVAVGFRAIAASMIQLLGYGFGFLKSWWLIEVLGGNEKVAFPKLFFK